MHNLGTLGIEASPAPMRYCIPRTPGACTNSNVVVTDQREPEDVPLALTLRTGRYDDY